MTARTYDVAITVADATNISTNRTITGVSSGAKGIITAIRADEVKVRLEDTKVSFIVGETVEVPDIETTTGSSLEDIPFNPDKQTSTVNLASTNITEIRLSPYVAEKNAFTQNPIIRLYKIYNPGSWYPPNEAGNPTGPGEGRAWPAKFPIKFAEVVGDTVDELSYAVSFGGEEYTPFPVNISSFDQGSDGKINELTLSVFNVDGIISNLVEDPYLVGLNTSNSVSAVVNGESVTGIDYRTVVGSLDYDQSIVDYYGTSNASFDYYQTQQLGGTWQRQKADTRDLQGAAVEITTTFAQFLDFWPEYSTITGTGVSEVVDTELGLLLDNTYAAGTLLVDDIAPYDVVYSADLVFPEAPIDGLIWEKGSTIAAGWLGIRDSGSTLRFRAGDGSLAKTASDATTAVLDITNFPKDGKKHRLTWEINRSTGTIRLWIDGYLKGTASNGNGEFITVEHSDLDAGSYLDTANAVCIGEALNATNFTEAGTGLREFLSELVLDSNTISYQVKNSLAYRVGDVIYAQGTSDQSTILEIRNDYLIVNRNLNPLASNIDKPILIHNPNADQDSSLTDVFKVDQLESLTEYVATFGLVSWLQHFKAALPKRRYMKNTCAWLYKGDECQYPSDGTGTIPGSAKTANGYFTAAGVPTSNPLEDVCSKSYESCSLRNNTIHYGAFTGVGRTVPRG